MTDIVERLRERARVGDGWTRPDAAEAADEIERLRATLLEAEMKAELDDLAEVGRLVAIGRREGIEAAAAIAANWNIPSVDKPRHILALLTEGGR